MYANYIRERNEAVENGAKHFTAKECYDSNGTTNEFGVKMRNYELGNGVILQILHTMFYEEENVSISKSENGWCLPSGEFLFENWSFPFCVTFPLFF